MKKKKKTAKNGGRQKRNQQKSLVGKEKIGKNSQSAKNISHLAKIWSLFTDFFFTDKVLWLLTQSYCAVPKNLRRQAGAIFAWYPKERGDLKMIPGENDVLTDDEYSIIRSLLRKTKYACLYIRNEHPFGFRLVLRY